MYAYPHFQIALMAKSPELGKAKTRLQPRYSKAFSLDLHTQLLDYILQTVSTVKVCPFQLWLAGEKAFFSERLPRWQSLDIKKQVGHDLGERMAFAVRHGLSQYQGVLLIGSDCPFIDADYLNMACAAMDEHDVVIAPASDGGYVFLGMREEYHDLFEGIDWGTSTVYEQTMEKVQALNLRVSHLPQRDDIDYPEDLKKLKTLPYFSNLLLKDAIDSSVL